MPTTDAGIWYPDDTEAISPLEALFERLAESVDVPEGSPLLRWRSMTRAAAGNIPNSAATTIGDNWTDLSGAPTNATSEIQISAGVFTVARDGKYFVWGGVYYTANGTGIRQVSFLHNGAATLKAFTAVPTAAAATQVETTWVGFLSAGDTLALQTLQTSGGSLALASNAARTFWGVSWEGPI
jgi:hypothetical protein